jgi:hypothetical protein
MEITDADRMAWVHANCKAVPIDPEPCHRFIWTCDRIRAGETPRQTIDRCIQEDRANA